MRIYREISVDKRLPNKEDRYGIILESNDCIDSAYFNGKRFEVSPHNKVEYWLELINLPDEKELEKGFDMERNSDMNFVNGRKSMRAFVLGEVYYDEPSNS